MSRAFTRESDDDPAALPDRPISEHPNLVTPAGLAAIEDRVRELETARRAARAAGDVAQRASVERDLRYWSQRRTSARLVPPAASTDRVRFGVRVTLLTGAGVEQTFCLVGEDEADAARGLLSWVSPLAQALLGKGPGDTVRFQDAQIEVVRIER